jgi:hypothetical protein
MSVPSTGRRRPGTEIAAEYLVDNSDRPVCSVCLVQRAGVSHITGLMRQLRDKGWVTATSQDVCGVCDKRTSHYQIVSSQPSKRRASVSPALRQWAVQAMGQVDAFSLLPSPKLELDHRIPHALATGDEAPVDESTVVARYQLLTPANNQQKRHACHLCQTTGCRPAFAGIDFWLEGSPDCPADCSQCPWAHPEVWRTAVHERLTCAAG